MTITIYEYLLATQPGILSLLRKTGLLVEPVVEPAIETRKNDISYAEVVHMMRHDKWRRVRGALRQVYPGRVIR